MPTSPIFFGTISHDRLVALVAERISDGKVLSLIRQILTAGALRDGVYESTIAGTPQGGVISPLLSNIYLHVFDEQMERAGVQLTRYADDWLAVCRTREEAESEIAAASAKLQAEADDARRRLSTDAESLGAAVAERILGRKAS